MRKYEREVFPGEAFRHWKRADLRRPATWPALGALTVMCRITKDCGLPKNPLHLTVGYRKDDNRAFYFNYGTSCLMVSTVKRNNGVWFCKAPIPSRLFSLADTRTWPEIGRPVILKMFMKAEYPAFKYSAGCFQRTAAGTLWWCSETVTDNSAATLCRKYNLYWEYLPEFDGRPYGEQ